ncbi:Protein kinase [Mortierella sp. AD010]|nr:Protein kinase [Mortierella sp. AD010]
MLVVDPLKRITIAEIRQNAWFNVGLPEYLKPLPQGVTDDIFCNLQEDIITELMKKMNFSRETIIQALEERQNNQIKVAYQLVVDHRRMIENASSMSPQKPLQSFLATSPPPWNDAEKDGSPAKSATGSSAGSALKSGLEGDISDDSADSPVPSSITVLSTSLPGNSFAKELHRKASLKNTRRERPTSLQSHPQSSNQNGQQLRQPVSPPSGHPDYSTTTSFHQAAVLGNSSIGGGGIPLPSRTGGLSYTSSSNSNLGAAPTAASAAQRRMRARPKWYFGIRSRSAPKEVMAEIYRALSNLSMKWKIINAYHLRAKYEYAVGFEVKIELQLYRLDNENYLVDFKYVGQQSASALEARTEMMRNLNEESLMETRFGGKSLQLSPSNATMNSANNISSDASETTPRVTSVTESYPTTAMAQGAAHIMSGPQDIPQSGHSVDQSDSAIPSPLPKHHAVAFETNTDQDSHSAGGERSSKRLSVLSSMSLPSTSSATVGRTGVGVGAGASAPGVLSSSLLQEQQHIKEMNELRQELQHQQRQRDLKQRPTHLLFPKASYQLASAKEVNSPFPFFDVCGKLITELAIGSG